MNNKNSLSINNLSNKYLNFKTYLTCKDSIEWKNCSLLNIIIKSKLNKLEFNNCSNIKLYLYGTISGLEINKSSNITIVIPNKHSISCIQTYQSYIDIKCNKLLFNLIPLINEKSIITLL
jgi:hypothetical protein